MATGDTGAAGNRIESSFADVRLRPTRPTGCECARTRCTWFSKLATRLALF